jgi:hypothetical protein
MSLLNLKYGNYSMASEEDAILFFDTHEKEIMGILSQYATIHSDLTDEELAALTIAYMCNPQDEETIDLEPVVDEEQDCDYSEEFIQRLFELIIFQAALNDMVQKGLLKRVQNGNETGFTCTELGLKVGEYLHNEDH